MPQSPTMPSKWKSLLTPLLAAMLAGASTAVAQTSPPIVVHLGGGAIMPSGDFGTYANTGWDGFVGVSKPLASRPDISLNAIAFYGHAGHDGPTGDATNIPGVGVGLNCALGNATMSARPYVGLSVGMLQHRYAPGDGGYGYGSESETKAFIGPAAGITFGRMLLDVRYIASDGTSFIPISLGFSMPVGGPKK